MAYFGGDSLNIYVQANNNNNIFLLCPLSLFALQYHFFLDDHEFFSKTKKKETHLMIIRQNALRRIKIQFHVIS
jgi:hypothetical protein